MGLLNSKKNVAVVYKKMNLREDALSIYAEILTEAAYHDLIPLKAETYNSIANIFLEPALREIGLSFLIQQSHELLLW